MHLILASKEFRLQVFCIHFFPFLFYFNRLLIKFVSVIIEGKTYIQLISFGTSGSTTKM